MEITYAIPHLFAPGVSLRENAEGLRVLLDALIGLNSWYLRHHAAPPLYASGVVYGRTDDWEPIPALYATGYHGTDKPDSSFSPRRGCFGDCKSLSAALIAEYRHQGKSAQPVFRFADISKTQRRLYHILVWTPYGFEDPSVKLGMGANEFAPFSRAEIRELRRQ